MNIVHLASNLFRLAWCVLWLCFMLIIHSHNRTDYMFTNYYVSDFVNMVTNNIKLKVERAIQIDLTANLSFLKEGNKHEIK